MMPALMPGDVVVGMKRRARVGDVVVAHVGNRDVIKRVSRQEGDVYYLLGDNSHESSDSRHYGNVSGSAIIGTIMIRFASAVAPPRPVKPYAATLGRVLAGVFVVMSLLHLFRIDTFMPVLDDVLPGGAGIATSAALLIVLSEVFAIPFLLRMKLSPLAHLVSGMLVVLAPLWWLLITIWAIGTPLSTGLLGAFTPATANILTILLVVLWLVVSYIALYVLGYNRLSVKSLLSK